MICINVERERLERERAIRQANVFAKGINKREKANLMSLARQVVDRPPGIRLHFAFSFIIFILSPSFTFTHPLQCAFHLFSPFFLSQELLMLGSLTVASSIISIITSYIIIDHNLIISFCLLVIFFMTFMLTLVLYLKPKVLVNQSSPSEECANDDHRQRGESQAQTLSHDTSSFSAVDAQLAAVLATTTATKTLVPAHAATPVTAT